MDEGELLEVGVAAARLGLSVARLRDLTDSGRIAALRTVRGQRIYRGEDIARLARLRREAQQERGRKT